MPNVHLIQPDGREVDLEVPLGSSVMQAAVSAGVHGIVGECGGSAMCATCHVYVGAQWLDRLPPMQSNEAEMLECTASPRLATSRLSCQILMTPALDGIELQLPESQQ
jgi:2Fe-2S ferredoxin